ncbi:hypothetical protein F3Y22_tig00111234pilonHSYRG00086 [Hibiscus syriacus]|uniref:Uncharacterized protein n=1 Tax=Hibiscus syriacus TaxID=106335 RepID=A0A6A2YTQ7_HIBSY|nr:hypothetical protein F3Y22_tig00111234pilonHSYRG00086 [Hibiscus syriacus]
MRRKQKPQKLALLEVECATLNQELQETEARAHQGQKKSPEEVNQMVQAEMQKLRVEMASMKRDAEHYSRQVMFKFIPLFSLLQTHVFMHLVPYACSNQK